MKNYPIKDLNCKHESEFLLLVTKKGNPNNPLRVMIYGVEGIGKSTLGARADAPIFISPEGGVDQVKNSKGEALDEMPNVSTWDAVREAIRKITIEEHAFQTLVLDSADWIEKLCHAKIIGQSGKSITTCNGGYGAGYRQSEIMHKDLIDDLTVLREKRKMNIIVIAHAQVRPVKDPSVMDDYDSFEIKCHELVASLWREYVDALLFARFRTFTKSDDTQRARALSDGSRVVYTVKQPSFQAKNRYTMLPEYNFNMEFWDILKSAAQNKLDLKPEILELLKLLPEDDIWKKAVEALEKAGDDFTKLNAIKKRLVEITGGVK